MLRTQVVDRTSLFISMPHMRAFTGWGMTSSSTPGSESFDPVRFDLSIASLNLKQVLSLRS